MRIWTKPKKLKMCSEKLIVMVTEKYLLWNFSQNCRRLWVGCTLGVPKMSKLGLKVNHHGFILLKAFSKNEVIAAKIHDFFSLIFFQLPK